MSGRSRANESRGAAAPHVAAHHCEPGCAVCTAYARVLHCWVEAISDRAAGADPVGVARRDPRVRRAVAELSAALGSVADGARTGDPLATSRPGSGRPGLH